MDRGLMKLMNHPGSQINHISYDCDIRMSDHSALKFLVPKEDLRKAYESIKKEK